MVSADISSSLRNEDVVLEGADIAYEYRGQTAVRVRISRAFAQRFGVSEFGSLDLPYDWPEWIDHLVVECKSCLAEAAAEADSR